MLSTSRRKPIAGGVQGANLVSLTSQSHAPRVPEHQCLNANTENMILLSDILQALQDVNSVPLVLHEVFLVKHFHIAHVHELLVAAGGKAPWTDVIVDRNTPVFRLN